MIELESAVSVLKENISAIKDTEKIPLINANGRILAEDIIAAFDQPPFARSPLDGYAVRGKDTVSASRDQAVKLKVIGKIYAGSVFHGLLGEGEAVRIMTGAPIPEGADTVIRQEDTDYGMKEVLIYQGSEPFKNYCPKGEDYLKGTCLLKSGQRLGAAEIAVLAGNGMTDVYVYRKPRIAVIATGDEISEPGEKLAPGKIYDTNLFYIYSRLTEFGCEPVIHMHYEDDADGLASMIRGIKGDVDLIITTGGVSVGEKDIMHEVIDKLYADKLFWKVALKPGAPTLAAVYEGVLMICLSGNPYGAAANFELLVRPVLAKLSSDDRWNIVIRDAIFSDSYKKDRKIRRFLRGIYQEGSVKITEGNQASGALSSMIGCNCLIEIRDYSEKVKVYML